MITSTLFLGGAATPTILQVGSGYLDDSVVYDLSALSVPIAPAGAGRECVFPFVHLTTRHYTANVSFWLSALVDEVAVARTRLDLKGDGSTTTGLVQSHVFALSIPYLRGGIERFRTAPRGVWFRLLVETKYAAAESGAAAAAAKQILESAEVEFQVTKRQYQAAAAVGVSP